MNKKRIATLTVVALVSFVALLLWEWLAPFSYIHLENSWRDALARYGRKTAPGDNLVFLAIDSDSVGLDESADVREMYGLTNTNSIEGRALTLMSHLYPWPREIYGLVLERLVKAGARVVIFDLTFPTSTSGDEPFRGALERFKDNVLVGSNFNSAANRGLTTTGASHTRPPETLIPQTEPMDQRVAFTNFWPDEDDVVRRAQYRVTFDQVEGRTPGTRSEVMLSLGARGLTKAGFGEAIPAGLESHAFRYTAPARQGFPPHSLFEIFVPDYWQHNYKNGEFFRGKVVLIGAEGNWQHDEHPTPFGLMPGPEVHLNAMNAALHHEFLREVTPIVVQALAAAVALLALALCIGVTSPWIRLGVLVTLDVAIAGLGLFAFNRAGYFVPFVGPATTLNFTILVGMIFDFAGEQIERKRVRRTLERYVSRDVVRELLDKPKLYAESLGGVVKPVSILFSDIRGYSTVSARTDPQALVAQLNEYLTAMVDCVFEHGGTLDKFIGDAVMAVWGNTRSAGLREDAANAVRAAIAMRAALVRLNEGWRQRGLPELRAGIAINHGRVVVGNIGSPQRMEFTVVGDAVNTSWRLQELTKTFGFDLLVGENVAKLVIEDFELQPLGPTTIRDNEPMEVFAVSGEIELASASKGTTRTSQITR